MLGNLLYMYVDLAKPHVKSTSLVGWHLSFLGVEPACHVFLGLTIYELTDDAIKSVVVTILIMTIFIPAWMCIDRVSLMLPVQLSTCVIMIILYCSGMPVVKAHFPVDSDNQRYVSFSTGSVLALLLLVLCTIVDVLYPCITV